MTNANFGSHRNILYLKMIVGFSFLAILATTYLTYLHFAPDAAEFCHFNDKFNCDLVNKSIWSVINLGFVKIPVSLMGLATYIILLVGSLGLVKGWAFTKIHSALTPTLVCRLLSYLTFIGVVFSLYLTYIEAFVLQTFCIFCLIQQLILLIIFVLFLVMRRNDLGDAKA